MPKQSPPPPPDRKSLAEAIALLSGVFRGPDSDSCRAMQDPSWFVPFQRLFTSPGDPAAATVERLSAWIRSQPDPDSLFESLETRYVRQFVNTRGMINAPLYHSCHEAEETPGRPGSLMGAAAQAMNQRLRQAGLALAGDPGQMPDHLSVELEYLYFLLTSRPESGAKATAESASAFAGHVMLPWVRRLSQRLAFGTGDSFYPGMVSLTIFVLDLIARRPAACERFPEGSV